ncbi:MAG: hypothetical protein HY841_07630 [Bacteroidetes bacterium]|nr:hypothetical protein [Bacteroidota bacterium]
MKTLRITLTSFAAVAVFGFIFTLSKCKKDTIIVVVQVHDTLKGKSISGICKYPDYTGTMVAAPGSVVSLYLGSSKTGSPVATAYADASGNYSLPYLLPNTYFLFATYNTNNVNYKPINGINFLTDATDASYAITMGSSNVTKNLDLLTEAPTGTRILTIIKADTNGSMGTKAYVPFESHSKCEWWTEYSGAGYDGGVNGTTLQGGFTTYGNNLPEYGWGLTNFYFDEANPQNDTIKGYVLLSHLTTFEAVRDSLYGGCVPKTLQVDTSGSTRTTVRAVPKTDTAWYYAPGGSVVKYGKGYLAHGFMTAFYKSAAGEIEPPRITPCSADTVSWNGKSPQYAGPWSQKITKQIDMYFEFQGVNTAWNATHTTFNKYAVFEGQFDFNRSDYYVKTTSIGNVMHVTPHVQLKGANNQVF